MQDVENMVNESFNFEEIKTMISKLKVGKAAGNDKIIPELLKNLYHHTLNVIIKTLNKIFASEEFPNESAVGIIVIIFKGGEKKDINNCRGITLLSIIGKLLVGHVE